MRSACELSPFRKHMLSADILVKKSKHNMAFAPHFENTFSPCLWLKKLVYFTREIERDNFFTSEIKIARSGQQVFNDFLNCKLTDAESREWVHSITCPLIDSTMLVNI